MSVQPQAAGGTFRYPPEGFSGTVTVASRNLSCLSVEVQMACHVGYESDEKDRHDVALLADRFGMKLPPAYRQAGAS